MVLPVLLYVRGLLFVWVGSGRRFGRAERLSPDRLRHLLLEWVAEGQRELRSEHPPVAHRATDHSAARMGGICAARAWLSRARGGGCNRYRALDTPLPKAGGGRRPPYARLYHAVHRAFGARPQHGGLALELCHVRLCPDPVLESARRSLPFDDLAPRPEALAWLRPPGSCTRPVRLYAALQLLRALGLLPLLRPVLRHQQAGVRAGVEELELAEHQDRGCVREGAEHARLPGGEHLRERVCREVVRGARKHFVASKRASPSRLCGWTGGPPSSVANARPSSIVVKMSSEHGG